MLGHLYHLRSLIHRLKRHLIQEIVFWQINFTGEEYSV